MRIAVDMDEVLADLHGAAVNLLERRGYRWTEAEMRGNRPWDLADEEHRREVIEMLDEGHLFGALAPMEGAPEALRQLMARHEIWIATAAFDHPGSFTPKLHWLRRHFPFIDFTRIVFCGDKSILAADVLIDDSPRHFENFGGTGVLFSAPHNLDHPHPHRLNDWSEAPRLFQQLEAAE